MSKHTSRPYAATLAPPLQHAVHASQLHLTKSCDGTRPEEVRYKCLRDILI